MPREMTKDPTMKTSQKGNGSQGLILSTSVGLVTNSHFVDEKSRSYNGCEFPKAMPLNCEFSPKLSGDHVFDAPEKSVNLAEKGFVD